MESRTDLRMNLKLYGAVFVIFACTATGFYLSVSMREEVKHLRDLVKIINFMECELSYRLTPLASLCRLSAEQGESLKEVFLFFAEELDRQISPDAESCMDVALTQIRGVSQCVTTFLHELGTSFGKFDLQGQVTEIKLVKERCIRSLNALETCIDLRSRNCQTIGFCIGIAMTIILL